jgi:hypothetical protein
MSENKTGPVTEADVDEFVANLSDADAAELRRQKLINKALARETPAAPDFSRMTDAELRDWSRRNHGF